MSDTFEDVCRRCHRLHTTESCVIDRLDVFMFGPIDNRIIHLLPTEIWQLLLSYLPINDVIPALPRTNKYLNEQVVWGKWSGVLLFSEMTQGPNGLDRPIFGSTNASWRPKLVTMMMRACQMGAKSKYVSTLLAGGANVRLVDEDNWTSLHFACNRPWGSYDTVDALLKSKADPNARNQFYTAPLGLACYRNNADVVDLLIEANGDVNLIDQDGYTPLMIACKCASIEVVRLLIHHGAAAIHYTLDDETALRLAIAYNTREVVQLIREQEELEENYLIQENS
jgi:Ankyrin repeats (3 copies)